MMFSYFRASFQTDLGLLLIRFSLAIIIFSSFLPVILEGPQRWEEIGAIVNTMGIKHFYDLFGLLYSCIFIGSALLLTLGLWTTLACATSSIISLFLTFSAFDLEKDPIFSTSYAALPITFLCLILIGPGRYSMDSLRFKKCQDVPLKQ